MQFLIGYNNDILCIHVLLYQGKANKSINNASRKLEFRQHISQQKIQAFISIWFLNPGQIDQAIEYQLKI